MKIIRLLFLFILVAGCSSPTSQPAATEPAKASVPAPAVADQVTGKADTANFPLQKVAVFHDEAALDLRLPYVRLISTDASKDYLVLATYKGEKIGFEVRMPSGGLAGAELISIGRPSDNFLWFLATEYKQEFDKAPHFADTVKVDCISMGSYVDSLRKDGQGDYVATEQNKLFFESNDSIWEAECYLNINATDHWVELDEIESDYRPKIIRDLSRRP